MWDQQLMKSPACSRSLHMRTKRGIYVSASTTWPASSSRIFCVFYQQNSLGALSIVKNVSHARKTDFSHEKPVALWILADHCRGGGVWTNELGILPVFWASHPVFLSIQQRMGAKGGAADHLHDRELGGCENPVTLLSGQFVYFYWDTNELLISCVQRSGWCEQDVFASTWQSYWEWVSDQIVIRPRLRYIWVNTHSSPPQHCWHCEIWLRDS